MSAREGVVLRSTAGFFDVETEAGVLRARLRGRLKRVKRNTDLCVIGDRVRLHVDEDGSASVEEVLPRRTVFSRQHPARGGHREDVLVANLDVLVVVMAYESPPFVARMVDRFLVIAEHNGVDAFVVINKADLREPEEDAMLDEALALYASLGYQTFQTSVEDDARLREGDPDEGGEASEAAGDPGLDALRGALGGKIAAFAGPSGAGKSSLVNRIQPGLDLRVGDTSEAHGKGRHTTRVATLHPVSAHPAGGYVADTPGIRELATFQIPERDLARCFPEMRRPHRRLRVPELPAPHRAGLPGARGRRGGRDRPRAIRELPPAPAQRGAPGSGGLDDPIAALWRRGPGRPARAAARARDDPPAAGPPAAGSDARAPHRGAGDRRDRRRRARRDRAERRRGAARGDSAARRIAARS